MLCDEKRALGARNRNTENMLLAFIKIDEIFIALLGLQRYVRYG